MSPRELYDKLKPFLSVQRSDPKKKVAARYFTEDNIEYDIRWRPKGEQRPTFTQFKLAYGLGGRHG